METLQTYFSSLQAKKAPQLWKLREPEISRQAKHAVKLRSTSNSKIYGSNTYTGHRDAENVDEKNLRNIDEEIIDSHTIGYGEGYTACEVRSITYAKIYSLAAGYSGISLQAYRKLCQLATDSDFLPYIPRNASYSSGDVIPASHWAQEAITRLQREDLSHESGLAMCLVNGNFVHLGLSAALIPLLKKVFLLFVETTRLQYHYNTLYPSELYYPARTVRTWTEDILKYMREGTCKRTADRIKQDAVSIRAIPQVIETFCEATQAYLTEVNHLLTQPSGNPLFDPSCDMALSQASFLSPPLTVKASALIDTLLFSAWAVVARTTVLLDGTRGFPQDGANEQNPLGLIQVPKLMMAKLQSARIQFGTRPFTTGSSTSYGVEDLWTHGLGTAEQLKEMLTVLLELCSLEAYVFSYLGTRFNSRHSIQNPIVTRLQSCLRPAEAVQVLKTERIPELNDIAFLFPIEIND